MINIERYVPEPRMDRKKEPNPLEIPGRRDIVIRPIGSPTRKPNEAPARIGDGERPQVVPLLDPDKIPGKGNPVPV